MSDKSKSKRYVPPHKRQVHKRQQNASATVVTSSPKPDSYNNQYHQPNFRNNHRHRHRTSNKDTSLHSSPNNNEMSFLDDDIDAGDNDDNKDSETVHVQLASEQSNKEEEESDKVFVEYLTNYKSEHKKKYLAPFQIRRLRKEYEEREKEKQKEKEKEKEKEDTKTESASTCSYPMEYLFFRDFYLKHSECYSEWQDMRHDGWNNKHLERFFDLKHKNQDNVSRSSEKNIISLFQRFYKYAIDIDNVCHYKTDLCDRVHSKKVYFLDIGFAPGGMSRLLLDSDQLIYGCGITLPPYECGNAFINELLYDQRFLCREFDIVALGKKVKNRTDFLQHCIVEKDYHSNCNSSGSLEWKQGFNGFDLIIVGITCHQDFKSNERLDHQILLSELYLAFLTLSHGGSILIRHKIALDCIHQHILFVFLSCFAEYKVGKPMTEFAIRKTFWILWKGFDKPKCKHLRVIYYLRKLIHEYDGSAPPYGKNNKSNEYNNPKMISETPQQIVSDKAEQIIAVMDFVFKIQMKSLKSFCNGKKDRLCSKGEYCKRNDCNRAHSKQECIDGFYDALVSVNSVLNKEILKNKHHSKILQQLHQQRHQHHQHNQFQSYNWRSNLT